jgi:hypothetical protein
MKAFGGTAPLNRVVDVWTATFMLPSIEVLGTAVAAGAVYFGQVGEPLVLEEHVVVAAPTNQGQSMR